MRRQFNREEHVYKNSEFIEVIKDAVRFFNGSPVCDLPPKEAFAGTGVYAIYYIGKHSEYAELSKINRMSYVLPIYVGKAVPRGWRQARATASPGEKELFLRLCDHQRSLVAAKNLEIDDFKCRFTIFEGDCSDMIGTVEAALIKYHQPLWNTVVDGFGNHDPGKGRYNQAKSDWDIIHPGRGWAEKCQGEHREQNTIKRGISYYFAELSEK